MHKLMDEYVKVLEKNSKVSNVTPTNFKETEIKMITFDYYIKDRYYSFNLIFLRDGYPSVFSNEDIEGIPHVSEPLIDDKFNFLCLFNSSLAISNGKTVEEKVEFILGRLDSLFDMSEVQKRQEYKKEYMYYWNKISQNTEEYFLFLDEDTVGLDVKLFYHNDKKFYFLIGQNKKLNRIYSSLVSEKITTPCIRLEIPSDKLLLPPVNKRWSQKEVWSLLESLPLSERSKLDNLDIPSNEAYIVLSFRVAGVIPLDLVLKITFNSMIKKTFKEKKKSLNEIIYISSVNSGIEKLFQRIGDNLERKKALVIGYGSLGSYITSELPSLGFTDLTIYDYDNLEAANIYRHRLGFRELFKNSTKKSALAELRLMEDYPEVTVTSYKKAFSFEDFKDIYDIIIINTGEVDLQLRFNAEFKKLGIKSPVIYNWLEYKGVGAHSLLVDYSKQGCFKCLYGNGTKNKVHFYNGSVKLSSTGCGGAFNSYGNQILLKGTSMVIDVIKESFKNSYSENLLFSSKLINHDDIDLENLRERYKLDSDTLLLGTNEYIDSTCEVCSNEGVSVSE